MAKEISEEERKHIEDMINGLVTRAKVASEQYMNLSQDQVNEIVKQMAMAGLEHHMELAKMAVEETGRGIYEDGWNPKIITFLVFADIIDLNIVVEVGLVTGVTPAIIPIGSAISS